MAQLNVTSAPEPVENKDNGEAIEEDNRSDNLNYEFSLLLREQPGAQNDQEGITTQREENEEVDDAVLELINAARTPHKTPRSSDEVNAKQHGGLSVTRTISGLFSEGMRILSSGIVNNPILANDNNSRNTTPLESPSSTMSRSVATTSDSKAPRKLGRPSVQLNPPGARKSKVSGKEDVYDIHASPEKTTAKADSTNSQSKQVQGVKRKRNEQPVAKQPSGKNKVPSSRPTPEESEGEPELGSSRTTPKPAGLPTTKQGTPTRLTRSRGSGALIVPVDYSRQPEKTAIKQRSTKDEVVDVPPNQNGRPKQNREAIRGSSIGLGSGSRLSTPSKQQRAAESIPPEGSSGPRRSKRTHFKDALSRTLSKSGNRKLQPGATLESSNTTVENRDEENNAPAKGIDGADDDEPEYSGGDNSGDGGEEELESENEAVDGDEIDDIPLNPKPTKIPPKPAISKDPSSRKGTVAPSSEAGDSSYTSDEDTDSEDNLLKTTNLAAKRLNKPQIPVSSSSFEGDFVAESHIAEVLELVETLGKHKDGELRIDKKRLKRGDTEQAKRIGRLTKSIISAYKAIQKLEENENPGTDTQEEYLSSVGTDLKSLEDVVRSIFEERLCDPDKLEDDGDNRDVQWRIQMLNDVFLNVMPDILKAAAAAIVTYGCERVPSTEELNEIFRYVKLVLDLLSIVESPHNTNYRPQAPPNRTYKVLQPFKSIRMLLRDFAVQCMAELRLRKQQAEAKRLAPIQKRKREEDQLAQEEARRKRRRQDMVNAAEFDRTRMKLGLLPIGSQMSQIMEWPQSPQPSQPQQSQELTITEQRIRAEREVTELTLRLKEAEQLAKKLRRDEQRLLQGYEVEDEDEAEYERVEMFPTDNNHGPAVEPWTQTEYEVLAEGLKVESGPDRYENLALRIDRSLDDIFEKAKEFKRMMIEYYRENQQPVEPWVESIGVEGILGTGD